MKKIILLCLLPIMAFSQNIDVKKANIRTSLTYKDSAVATMYSGVIPNTTKVGKMIVDSLGKTGWTVDGDSTQTIKTVKLGTWLQFPLDTMPVTHKEGTVFWDNVDGTIGVMTDVSGTTVQVGQELLTRVVNKTGAPLANGAVVYINGAQGNRSTVAKADADLTTATSVIGVVTSTGGIAHNGEGFICTYGNLRDFNTSGFSAGDTLYLSQTAGAITNVMPPYPANIVRVGYAENSTNNGKILVSIANIDRGFGAWTVDNDSVKNNKNTLLIGTATDYVRIDTSYGVKLAGNATAWNDLTASSLAFASGTNAPTLTEITTGTWVQCYNYAVANDISFTSLQMAHNYAEGTDAEPHIHYSIDGNGVSTDTVVLRVSINWFNVGAAIGAATTTDYKIPMGSKTADTHYIYDLNALTGTGKTLSSVFTVRIERLQNSGSDTYNNWFCIHDFDVHYQIDGFGSRSEYVK
jgi:hypothetical protein